LPESFFQMPKMSKFNNATKASSLEKKGKWAALFHVL